MNARVLRSATSAVLGALALLLINSAPSIAQGDAVGAAEAAIEKFDAAAADYAKANGLEKEAGKKITSERRDAEDRLRDIKLTETPGQRRFAKVSRLFEEHASAVLDTLKGATAAAPEARRQRAAEGLTKLRKLKEELSAEIEGTRESETYMERMKERPIPAPSRMPQEPGEGLLYR